MGKLITCFPTIDPSRENTFLDRKGESKRSGSDIVVVSTAARGAGQSSNHSET